MAMLFDQSHFLLRWRWLLLYAEQPSPLLPSQKGQVGSCVEQSLEHVHGVRLTGFGA